MNPVIRDTNSDASEDESPYLSNKLPGTEEITMSRPATVQQKINKPKARINHRFMSKKVHIIQKS